MSTMPARMDSWSISSHSSSVASGFSVFIRTNSTATFIAGCRYGIHDISRTELDENSGFPRFNMPLEFGVFLGAKKFGVAEQKRKKCLVLDKEPYRYQQFISDIAGQDIQVHNNEVETIVRVVRNWLRTASGRQTIPGANIIWERYQIFLRDLPQTAEECLLEADDLIFNDYLLVIAAWQETNDE